ICSSVTPASEATSNAVNSGAPRIECPSSSRPRPNSGAIVVPTLLRELVQLLGDQQLHVLHPRDVVQLDPTGGAGVRDDQGAAAEDPVHHADLEVHAADPVEGDR